MYILLVGGDRNFANNLVFNFNDYLDKGYTYQDIKNEILSTFKIKKNNFRCGRFNNFKTNPPAEVNILKSNTNYYHKELKLINKPPTVEFDIDKGVMTSRKDEYFLEPVGSYTIQDLIKYFCNNVPFDVQAFPLNKIGGMLRYKMEQFGLDKLLFMLDLQSQECKDNNKLFSLSELDNFSSKADECIQEITKNIPKGEKYYVIKQRRLFDV